MRLSARLQYFRLVAIGDSTSFDLDQTIVKIKQSFYCFIRFISMWSNILINEFGDFTVFTFYFNDMSVLMPYPYYGSDNQVGSQYYKRYAEE